MVIGGDSVLSKAKGATGVALAKKTAKVRKWSDRPQEQRQAAKAADMRAGNVPKAGMKAMNGGGGSMSRSSQKYVAPKEEKPKAKPKPLIERQGLGAAWSRPGAAHDRGEPGPVNRDAKLAVTPCGALSAHRPRDGNAPLCGRQLPPKEPSLCRVLEA